MTERFTPKEIWIDLDGTLVMSQPVLLKLQFIRKYFRYLVPVWGWRRSYRLLRAMKNTIVTQTGQTNLQRMTEIISSETGDNPAKAEATFRNKIYAIFRSLSGYFSAADNAREFILTAKSLAPLVLATNPVWPAEIANYRMRLAGLTLEDFDFVTTAENMSASKSTLAYYEELLEKRNRSADEVLLIGNDLKKDGIAAQLGIRTFIVNQVGRRRASSNENIKFSTLQKLTSIFSEGRLA